MNKTTEVFESENSNYSSTSVERALKLAEEALNAMLTHMGMDEDEWTKPTFNQAREALAAIREALANQSIVLNDPHPPHRLCECTACLEYWTPLPDCDAFAASGKPIDHIADTGKVIAEPVCKRCNGTKIVSDGEIDNIGGADLEVPIECVRDCPDCAKPVKQEPWHWADECRITLVTAIHMLSSDFENALYVFRDDTEARKVAEGSIAFARSRAQKWNWNGCAASQTVKQEPVAVISESAIGLVKLHSNGACLPFGTQLYAAPVGADHFLKAIAALREGITTCRAEALEEAAKVCEEEHDNSKFGCNGMHCAAAIREMK